MDKIAMMKAALAARKNKPVEGSPAEEKSESKAFEAKEDKGSGKPSAGLKPEQKSAAVKKARKGADFGKKNVPGKTGFKAVEDKAAKETGSQAAGKRVAGAIFWKMQHRKV